MIFLLVCVASLLMGSGNCVNYTVTHYAWFKVSATDLDGPGLPYVGKFTVALFGDIVPITVRNFVALAKGHKTRQGTILHYKDSAVHRLVRDFVIQMGDVVEKTGRSGRSIYGPLFSDENFVLSHRSPGWVSMANAGNDTNASQFFILINRARWLDGKHVVFGKVVRGFNVVKKIADAPTFGGTSTPISKIVITDCDAAKLDRLYELEEKYLDSTEDIDNPLW